METAEQLTLCLTTQAKGGERKLIQATSSDTVEQLWKQAEKVLLPGKASSKKRIIHLSYGFPPKKLSSEDGDKSLSNVGIQNQERIVVQIEARSAKKVAESQPKQKNGSNSQADKSTTEIEKAAIESDRCVAGSEPIRKSRRAAAARATANLPASIAAQEMLEKENRAKATSSKQKANSKPAAKTAATTTRPLKRPWTAASAGRRLQDGVTVTPPKRRTTKQQQNNGDSSDPSLQLLGSLQDSSGQGRLMRKGWRQAVNSAYEHNQAASRLAAIPDFVQYIVNNNEKRVDVIEKIKVKYRKGVQGRGYYEEEVDLIPPEVLTSVIGGIHPSNAEALRPSNLALLSPRVLWSLAYHYQGSGIEDALRLTQPDLDWSFLRRRKEQLSEKAIENRRQEMESKGENDKYEAAAAAIESVEAAMSDLSAWDRSRKQARVLNAIDQRQDWKVVTPTEFDEDELLECIAEAPITGVDDMSIVKLLVDKASIHNWRELANCSANELVDQLELGRTSVECMQHWIDKAQQESVDEIIVEICDGQQDIVELLRDYANSGTPKDLAIWTSIPNVLLDELAKATHSSDVELPSLETVAKWCYRSKQAIEQFDWLGDYRTPIE